MERGEGGVLEREGRVEREGGVGVGEGEGEGGGLEEEGGYVGREEGGVWERELGSLGDDHYKRKKKKWGRSL